jgi:hypothetical protein
MKTSLPWGGRFALLLLPRGALSFFSAGPRVAGRVTIEGISGGVVPSGTSSANGTGTVALYGITFTATGTMSSGATSKSLALGGGPGYEFAPMTEFFNSTTGTDWLLFSAIQSTQYNVASSNITNVFPTVFSAVKDGVGTSGIVDSNASTTTFPQAASIYFNALSQNNNCNNHTNPGNTDGCAVKLTQAGLQQNHA